ncbi:MAG: GNAT family N-acetyltransferase [Flavobacteriaceae bacterium]|jgi:[ribosomal protein S5]-alanine N-acetyltransferase
MSDVIVSEISAQETWSVRHPVLRAGRPLEDCAFPHDEDQSTAHFGAFYQGQLVGVVTLLHPSERQFQLRGMAVLTDLQKLKIGSQLVNHLEARVVSTGGGRIWMNARAIAVPFYLKLGYHICSEVFDIPRIGPHYVMEKTVG